MGGRPERFGLSFKEGKRDITDIAGGEEGKRDITEGGRGQPLSGTRETWVARFVAAFVIPIRHPAFVICHPAFVNCHFSFPIPRSEFRIPHFLAEVANHFLAPGKRGWPLSPPMAA